MCRRFVFTLLVFSCAVQSPAAESARAVQRSQAAPARSGIAITVTDPQGFTLPGVRVDLLGPSERGTDTNASGQVSFAGLQVGTYRLRFSGDAVISFEREITVREGEVATVDITLTAAPPPPAPPPAPEPPPPPPVGPLGQPQTLSIVDLVEQAPISGNQPRLERLLSCSGNMRTTLVQLNGEQPNRLYDTAEVSYYVVAGEGTASMNDRDTLLEAGSFVAVPRGTAHALMRRGRRPFVMIATLSGAPCEEAR